MKSGNSEWQQLKHQLWDKNLDYHLHTSKGIVDGFRKNHPGLAEIKKLSLNAKKILDGGCGGGTFLDLIYKKEKKYFGVDVSRLAINQALLRLKGKNNVQLKIANLEKLPFPDSQFDLSYSAFVLEHLQNPQKAIEEMIRATAIGGKIVILCPNFGCPHWSSPADDPGFGYLFWRGIKLFVKSHVRMLLEGQGDLGWEHCHPLILEKRGNNFMLDWDAVSEPYLGSLLSFLKTKKVKIIKYSSGWNWQEEESHLIGKFSRLFQLIRKLFKILGELGVPPYKYYGPVLFVVGEKQE